MKVFVAGATGAIGRQLIPKLMEAGHEVTGMVRSERGREVVSAMGAQAVRADALEVDQVAEAVAEAEPDVIVHQLTAIPGRIDMRHFDETFAATNRLRTEGTDILLSAGEAIGVRRFIVQSYAGWPLRRSGNPVKTESEEMDPEPARAMRVTHAALRHLEEAVLGASWTEGVVMRYGALYGPGTSLTAGGEQTTLIRRRKFPLVGDGQGIWSFVHVRDAADATVLAVERGQGGVYHITDDEPAPVAQWLPAAAEAIGARRPQRVPRWVGRLLAGEAAVVMMTEITGASNEKAKRELGWRPGHPSWRLAFPTELV